MSSDTNGRHHPDTASKSFALRPWTGESAGQDVRFGTDRVSNGHQAPSGLGADGLARTGRRIFPRDQSAAAFILERSCPSDRGSCAGSVLLQHSPRQLHAGSGRRLGDFGNPVRSAHGFRRSYCWPARRTQNDRPSSNIGAEGSRWRPQSDGSTLRGDLDMPISAIPVYRPIRRSTMDVLVRPAAHCGASCFPLMPPDVGALARQLKATVLQFHSGPVDDSRSSNTILIGSTTASPPVAFGKCLPVGETLRSCHADWALGLEHRHPEHDQPAVAAGMVGRGWRGGNARGYAREAASVRAMGSRKCRTGRQIHAGEKRISSRAMFGEYAWANAMTRTMLGVRLEVEQFWPTVQW